jgi:hypothetical protein
MRLIGPETAVATVDYNLQGRLIRLSTRVLRNRLELPGPGRDPGGTHPGQDSGRPVETR